MDRLYFYWKELNEGSWKSTYSFNGEKAEATMTVLIPQPVTVQHFTPIILGSNSVVRPAGGLPTLHRETPAKHPRMPWMRAVDLSVEGYGKIHNTYNNMVSGAVGENQQIVNGPATQGTWGDLDHWVVRIRFESKLYAVLEDSEINSKEYLRFTEWEPLKPTIETLARKDRSWFYTETRASALLGPGGAPITGPPGDTLLRVPKAKLIVWWRNVPLDWIGGINGSSISAGIGKLNMTAFPQSPPTGLGVSSFPAGTLLMLTPDIQLKNNVPSQINQNTAVPQNFNKVCDIKFEFLYFNPDSIDTTVVQLNGLLTPVRGHNLWPVPQPIWNPADSRYYSWWTAASVRVVPALAAILQDDSSLLYQYYDFEQLFKYGGV